MISVNRSKFVVALTMIEAAFGFIEDALTLLRDALHRCDNCGCVIDGYPCDRCGWSPK